MTAQYKNKQINKQTRSSEDAASQRDKDSYTKLFSSLLAPSETVHDFVKIFHLRLAIKLDTELYIKHVTIFA